MSKHEERSGRQRRSAAGSPHGGDAGSAGHRHERLSRLLREEIDALVRDELSDPRLDGVTVTFVELSVDYKNARIGFVRSGSREAAREDRDRMERALVRATPFLRGRLSEALDLKQVPVLRFAWDAYAAAQPGGED